MISPDNTILGLLAVEARHGYQLLEAFQNKQQLGRVWKMSTSQLYNVLKRLERSALIVGRAFVSESGPPRMEYSLTECGRQTMLDWLHEPEPSPSIRSLRVEFLSRLFIAHELGLSTAQIVASQRNTCLIEHQRLTEELAAMPPGMHRLTVEFMLGQLGMVIQWITHCESGLFVQ